MHRITIDEAKARLRLPELARHLGVPEPIPERDGFSVRCFWPERHKHGDRSESFNFHSSLTRYKCFACGASGDGPDLIAEWQGIGPKEALAVFMELAGGGAALPPVAHRVAVPVPESDPWGDTPEKREKRRLWPSLSKGTTSQLAAVAELRGIDVEIIRAAADAGWLAFCELAHRPAWALRSDCGRVVQVRRMDGKPWQRAGHEFKAWSLPGSLASVPLGFSTLADDGRMAAIAEGGPDWLAVWQLLHEQDRMDCAVLGLLGASVKLATPLLSRLRGRRVRLFSHADDAGRSAAAEWSLQLSDAGCIVDAFDFGAFSVKDANDFVNLPLIQRDVEVMP